MKKYSELLKGLYGESELKDNVIDILLNIWKKYSTFTTNLKIT